VPGDVAWVGTVLPYTAVEQLSREAAVVAAGKGRLPYASRKRPRRSAPARQAGSKSGSPDQGKP